MENHCEIIVDERGHISVAAVDTDSLTLDSWRQSDCLVWISAEVSDRIVQSMNPIVLNMSKVQAGGGVNSLI